MKYTVSIWNFEKLNKSHYGMFVLSEICIISKQNFWKYFFWNLKNFGQYKRSLVPFYLISHFKSLSLFLWIGVVAVNDSKLGHVTHVVYGLKGMWYLIYFLHNNKYFFAETLVNGIE